MNTIYLMATNDKFTLNHKIQEILKKNQEAEVVSYDLLEVPIDQLIEDLDTYNFLTSKKIVVGYHAMFLSSEKDKSVVEHHLEKLEKYLEHPSLDNILILVCDSLDKRKKITASLLKIANVISESHSLHEMIQEKLEDYQMDMKAEKKLLEYCQNDSERIIQELEKLKLYQLEEKKIKESDIEEIVMQSLDDNIFHLADAILSKNKKYAFALYQNFLLHGEQLVNIIRILDNKIRLMYQVKVLLQDGNSDLKISKLLKVHEYPVKLAREASYRYSDKTLLEAIETLAKLDLAIKSGESSGQVEFEMMLARL